MPNRQPLPRTEPPDEPPCECPGPGHCPRYKIDQDAYAHAVCANRPVDGWYVTEAKSQAYRKKWRKLLDRREGRSPAPVPSGEPVTRPHPRGGRAVNTLPPEERPAYAPPPAEGPGTELKAILDALGFAQGGCKCRDRMAAMNIWGVEGCRRNAGLIVEWLREEAGKRGWWEKLKAGTTAAGMTARGELPLLDPFDPAPGLLAEAVRRWEVKSRPNTDE